MFILVSRKVIEQKQKAKVRVTQIKKTPRMMDNGLSDQHKHYYYDVNKSQNSQSYAEVDPNEINDLNIC